MGSVIVRYFCYGCFFIFAIWTVLFFVYFNFSEVIQLFRNVFIKGFGFYGFFFKKFYFRFIRGLSRVLELQFKVNKIDDMRDNNYIEDLEKDNVKFFFELGKCI